MTKRFHVALAVPDLAAAISDFTHRLGVEPEVVAAGTYALFRTESLNVSLSEVRGAPAALRHLGFEDPNAPSFSEEKDASNIVWERFTADQQHAEIDTRWPNSKWRK